MSLFTERVAQVAFDRDRLFGPGDALPANRAVRVGRVTEREIVGGDRNRKSGSRRPGGADSLGISEVQRIVETV